MVVRCLIAAPAGDLLVRPSCTAIALPGRQFDHRLAHRISDRPCASHRKIGITGHTARSRKPPAAGCRSSGADRATQPTHHPELEPASASTEDHNHLDRVDPTPITIEAEMPSPPAEHAAHDGRARRSPAKSEIKHLTPVRPTSNATICRL